MNIVCDKTLLSAAIDGVSKAVTMRSAIPVLEGILLKAEGFQLTLTGYDLEMGIVTTIEANVKEPGEIVLNAKLLSSMISRMPAGQISILSADNGKTTIKSGVAEFEIQSMAATDFPDLPNTGAEETLTIPTGVLRDMIDRTLYAVSQDEKKPAHTGELFEIEPDKLTIVALDGYRLAIVERPVTAVKDIRIIVPSKTMTEVAHLLPNDDEEPVHICANRRYVVFMAAGYTIMSRLIEGEFLNYHNVIPAGRHNCRSTLKRLNKVRFDCILEKCSHCSLCFQIFGINGFTAVCVCNKNVAESFFKVGDIICKTENCHNFRCNCNDEVIFPRNTVHLTAKTDCDIS